MLPYVSIGPLPTTLLSNSAGLINAQANATLLLLFNRNLRNIAKGSIAQVQSIRIIQTKVTPFSGMQHRSAFK
uniref:ATP synthase F0 subunit 6 n=1 Tax=Panagrolaimus davidi TaxID=227884 RepID=A0A914Q865_9BILA